MTDEINALLEELLKTGAVALTGAGVSTDSGIPDYRSQGGLWDRYHPITFQEFLTCKDSRIEYWRRKKEVYPAVRDARPGPVHTTLKQLEDLGLLKGIITQNIDGLHARAGSRSIVEIHGTTLETICLECGKTAPIEPALEHFTQTGECPLCPACEGLLKPNTISFGQALDPGTLHQAVDWVQQTGLLLCIGSSLVVEPAASLPRYAKRARAKVFIINREPTPIDSLADRVIHTELGPFFSALSEKLAAPSS